MTDSTSAFAVYADKYSFMQDKRKSRPDRAALRKCLFVDHTACAVVIGGIVGALISLLISIIMNASGEKIAAMMDMYGSTTVSIMTPKLLGAGILFSVIIGLFSGYFPARKAMKLSALSAIKTE